MAIQVLELSSLFFSSREELKGASSLSPSKQVITCAFCCCSEKLPWFKREIKSYGPLSKLAGSPSSNGGIFRPYLETDSNSTRSHSPEMKDTGTPSTPSSIGGGGVSNALPMFVGHFFRTSVQNVADVEELIWCHVACMEWSTCTNRKFSENILMVLANALTQVSYILYQTKQCRAKFSSAFILRRPLQSFSSALIFCHLSLLGADIVWSVYAFTL